jgi:hypothetical protein
MIRSMNFAIQFIAKNPVSAFVCLTLLYLGIGFLEHRLHDLDIDFSYAVVEAPFVVIICWGLFKKTTYVFFLLALCLPLAALAIIIDLFSGAGLIGIRVAMIFVTCLCSFGFYKGFRAAQRSI